MDERLDILASCGVQEDGDGAIDPADKVAALRADLVRGKRRERAGGVGSAVEGLEAKQREEGEYIIVRVCLHDGLEGRLVENTGSVRAFRCRECRLRRDDGG